MNFDEFTRIGAKGKPSRLSWEHLTMASALDRGLRQFFAKGRKDWEAGKAETGKAPFDWQDYEQRFREQRHFARLSDEEWRLVLDALSRAKIRVHDEAALRDEIDIAAFSSGWFWGFGSVGLPSRVALNRIRKSDRKLVEKIENLLPEIQSYLGSPPDYFGDDFYDLYDRFRILDELLSSFVQHIRLSSRRRDEMYLDVNENKSNAAYDVSLIRWTNSLINIWVTNLNQNIKNGVHLQRFIIACAAPYGWLKFSDVAQDKERSARYIIALVLKMKNRPNDLRRIGRMRMGIKPSSIEHDK